MEAATRHGMKYIANTDHLYQSGSNNDIHNEFIRMRYMADRVNKYSDVTVIGSAEFNVMIDPKEFRYVKDHLKWKPLGLHGMLYDITKESFDSLYADYVKRSEWNNAFVHIERELDRVNNYESRNEITNSCKEYMEKLVELAKKKDIYLEVNEASFEAEGHNVIDRLKYWLTIARDNGNMIYLGSDAHYCEEVGVFPNAIKLINEVGIDKAKILNCDEDKLRLFV